MRDEFLSVVIPAYNEEGRLAATVSRIVEYAGSNFDRYEVLVVDDGSTDGTAGLARELSIGRPELSVIRNEENRGKGYSVRRGMLSAGGDLLLLSDADLSTPIEEMDKLLRYIDEGYDVAIGSRGLSDSQVEVRQPWYRERMGKTFNFLVRSLLIRGFRDTQCGFKLFRGEAAGEAFGRSTINGFAFDVEVLVIAERLGFRIREVPVRWLNSPHSKVGVVRDSARMFLDLLVIKMNSLRNAYGPRKSPPRA